MSHSDDSRQRSIEAVHRGFLYQHLYGVGCLLLGRTRPEIQQVATERDEDIELVLDTEHQYIQIKTRGRSLQLAEMSSTLDRFVKIQEEHKQGLRRGEPKFFIVCDHEASDALKADSRFVQVGVHLITPSAPLDDESELPPAWGSVSEALEWCRAQAALIPQTRLEPSTLVWKLATEVALAAAGERASGHVFQTAALEELFELLFIRIQRLPRAPEPYRSIESEPELENANRLRLVVALSGGGKTAWLAEHALHIAGPLVYFDVADNSDGTVASALVREIVGVLSEVGDATELKRALYAGATGLASLKAIDVALRRAGATISIAVDNAHRVSAGRMSEMISSLESVRWILLAQPSPQVLELRSRLECDEETLGGLTPEAIAAEFREAGSPATMTQALRVKALTGGLPLFVKDAARLCARRYSGDCEALCTALEEAATTESSAQDIVLQAALGHLTAQARRAADALSLSDVRLSEDETLRLLTEGIGLHGHEARASIRELTDWGIAQIFENRALSLHDAFRSVLRRSIRLSSEDSVKALRVLGGILKESISPAAPDRFLAYCRIAPRIGEADVVVDMAGSVPEHLHEHGSSDALRVILADTLDDPTLSDEDRFWAADTLTFWDIQRGADPDSVRRDMAILEQRFIPLAQNLRARQTIAIKRLLVAGKSRNLEEVRRIYASAHADFVNDPHGWLILRYTYGVGLLYCDQLEAADLVTRTVAKGYLDLVGLRPQDLFMANPPELRRMLGQGAGEIELLKHVGDAIDLRARVVGANGGAVALLKMWAFKLFALANAPLSAVNAGKDVVDELVSIGAVDDARRFMEQTLMPGIAEYRLVEEVIPLRAQYAMVLAYAGEVNRARDELQALTMFESSSRIFAAELANQQRLVDAIASGRHRLRISRERNLDGSGMLIDAPRLASGRNDRCPCGSTLKTKRCCGR